MFVIASGKGWAFSVETCRSMKCIFKLWLRGHNNIQPNITEYNDRIKTICRIIYIECHDVECHDIECHYVECHDVECHYVECDDIECHDVECHYAERCYIKCHYHEGHYAEFRYAERHGAMIALQTAN